MDTAVYVNWEGRGYSHDCWIRDQALVEGILGLHHEPEIEFVIWDVGILFRRKGSDPKVVISISKGSVYTPDSWEEFTGGEMDQEAQWIKDHWKAYACIEDARQANPYLFGVNRP